MGDEMKKTSLSASELWKQEEIRMKMKKMLAILAALSVLGTTGLTVGAEDATTTEPATETVITTEPIEETTDAETTVVETTAVEEETVATEENQTVEEEGTKEVLATTTCQVGEYAQGTDDLSQNDICTLSVEVYTYRGTGNDDPIYLSILMDGSPSNLMDVVVRKNSAAGTSDAMASQKDINSYFKVTGERTIAINVEGNWQEYTYNANSLLPAGTEPVTTTTTASETTTTTTTTTTSEADLEAAKKALYEVYAAKYKPAVSGYETVEYHIVDGVLTSATIIVEDQDEKVVKTFFVTKDGATLINSVLMGGMLYGFESTDFTCDGYQFYAQFVKPMSDADARSYLTIYVYDNDGNLIPTNINGLQVGSAVYTRMEDGSFDWAGNFKLKLDDCLSSNGDTITINRSLYEWYGTQEDYTSTVDSTTYTYDAATNTFVTGGSTPTTPDEEMTTIEIYNNGLVTLSGTVSFEKDMTNYWHDILTLDKPVKVIYMDSMGGMVEPGTTEVIDSVQISFDRTVSIPEGTHITVTGSAMHSHTAHHLRSLVLMDCTYQLDGKTDNGSASNAPASTATKNTSGTPKTGDMTTVPAVAVGLTLTAAGVVAFISKRKK